MAKQEIKNYSLDVQELYLNFILSDPSTFARCQNIISVDYWHDKLKPAVRYLLDFSQEYHTIPTPEQLKAEAGFSHERITDISAQHTVWILSEVEQFCRHRAVELVMFDGADAITEGRYSEIESKLKDALTISLEKDLGIDYWADPKKRINEVLDRKDIVSTGWKTLDHKLYGGFTRGGLNIFAGGSGSGKSIFLQNLAVNWAKDLGMDVVYISLELSENLVASRLDAMVTNMSTKDVFKKLDEVEIAINYAKKKSGKLTIKKFPEAGTTCNDLRAYLKEYEIQNGKLPDALLVDYLDLMYPNNGKINPSDLFIKDKFVSEELRALSGEFNLIMASASQLNRAATQANGEFDHSHIAGGISKINTADNVFAIFTSPSMKERGEYQLLMLKTRSSNAVGQRLDLKYNPDTLRVLDYNENELEERQSSISTSSISEGITKRFAQPASSDSSFNNSNNSSGGGFSGGSKAERMLGMLSKTSRL